MIRTYFVFHYVACDNITINCPRGSQCKVDETVHQAYCEPSCDLDNGGCADNEVCTLQQQTCTNGPCPSVVQCLSELCYIQYCLQNPVHMYVCTGIRYICITMFI